MLNKLTQNNISYISHQIAERFGFNKYFNKYGRTLEIYRLDKIEYNPILVMQFG